LSSAYLFVSHGSRDPRPQIAVDRLAQQLNLDLQQLSPPNVKVLIATAQLELADQPLHLQISDFAHNKCIENGIERVTIIPLFLNPGVHVMEDIPAEVALAKREIGERLKLTVAPFLSTYPDFINLFAESRSQLPSSTIILAHGSRREGGNTVVEQLAAGLNAEIAYWSIEPSLTDRVAALVATGVTEIGILPYFLFTGGITDAIAELVTKLRQQFPQVRLRLGEPIGNSPEFVQTIGEILRSIAACTPSPDNGNI
jgi:sirohydrochlorin cobaltochelatase